MANSSIKFDDFFQNLPHLPLVRICKNLKPTQLIACSLLSDKWKDAVRDVQHPNEASLDIQFEPKNFKATVMFEKVPSKNFTVTYSEVTEECKTQMNGDKNFWFDQNVFHFTAKKFELVVEDCFKMLDLIKKVFRLVTNEIVLNLNRKSAEFTDRILLWLPKGKGHSLELKSETEEVGLVKEATLKQVLENVQFSHHVLLNTQLESVFDSEQINLNVSSWLKIDDARFLTQSSLLNMRFQRGTFGTNSFTSEDFNLFFQQWQNANDGGFLKEARFLISDDQDIDMDKVVQNLDAVPFHEELRDKGRKIYPEGKWINMEKGFDFGNEHGKATTVCIVENYLFFLLWESRFPMQRAWDDLGTQMTAAKHQMADYLTLMQTWEEQVDNVVDEAVFLETVQKIKECDVTLRNIQAEFEELRRIFAEL